MVIVIFRHELEYFHLIGHTMNFEKDFCIFNKMVLIYNMVLERRYYFEGF